MSDYDMTFDKKIVDDASFDTIFGGEEDDHLMELVMKEDADAFNIDERDPDGVEDGTGAIGKGSGIGSDVGPNHDAIKPSDDTSDQDALAKSNKSLKSNDQLNVSDTTGGKVTDGYTVKDFNTYGTDEVVGNDPTSCPDCIEDDLEKMTNKTDSFDEAVARLLEDVDGALGTTPVPVENPDTAPSAEDLDNDFVALPVSGPVTPDAEVPAPVASGSDADGNVSDMDLLDTDPVDDGPVGESTDEDSVDVEDLDKEDVEESSVKDVASRVVDKTKAAGAKVAEYAKNKFSSDKNSKDSTSDLDDLDEASELIDTDDVKDKVNMGGVEDKLGKIGAGDGLGNDLGPNHDAIKPSDDTSDMDLLDDDKTLKSDDQLNVSDTTGAKVTDGSMVKDFDNVGEDRKAASDSFSEASVDDLERMSKEEEDDIIDAVESNDARSEYTPSQLNADEDDEILDMLD